MNKIKYKTKNGNLIDIPVLSGVMYEQMPMLKMIGYTPISMAEIMEQRINAWQSRTESDLLVHTTYLEQYWCRDNHDTGDAIVHHPDGKIKIVPKSKNLRNLNINNAKRCDCGVFPLEKGSYDKIQGIEFSKADIKKFANKPLTKHEAMENPIWLAFAQGNKELLKEYIENVSSRIQFRNIMKIHLPNNHEKKEFEQALHIEQAYDLKQSNVRCNGVSIGYNWGYLIGVPMKENLVEVKKNTNNLENLMEDIA